MTEKLQESINAEGSFDEIVEAAVKAGIPSKAVARLGLKTIFDNPELISENDEIHSCAPSEGQSDGASGFLIGRNSKFYVNIKTPLVIVAFGFASDAALRIANIDFNETLQSLAVCGLDMAAFSLGAVEQKPLIFQLDENSGEKCILLEFAKGKYHTAKTPREIRRKIRNTCQKTYDCRYLGDKGECKCKKNDIEKICCTLCEKGALKRNGAGYSYCRL